MDISVRNVCKHNLSLCTESTIFGCWWCGALSGSFVIKNETSLAEAEVCSKRLSFVKRFTPRRYETCRKWLWWMANQNYAALNGYWKRLPRTKSLREKPWKMRRKRFVFTLNRDHENQHNFPFGLSARPSRWRLFPAWSSHPYNKHKQFLHVLHQPILWHLWFFSFGRSFSKYAFCGELVRVFIVV